MKDHSVICCVVTSASISHHASHQIAQCREKKIGGESQGKSEGR